MGVTTQVDGVMPMCALMSRHQAAIDWALAKYTDAGYAIVVQSHEMTFDYSNYYESEMGKELKKVLVGFGPLRDPKDLADWKLSSNAWERDYAMQAAHDEMRPLNLDPGYITLAKFVLATTKDRDHRIYLHEGIFAEVTMSYARRRWQHHRWTYPDYQSEESHQFLNEARQKLKHMLQSRGKDEP